MNALVPVQSQTAIAAAPAYSMGDMEKIARAIAGSKLFGAQTPEQALALCLIAQAEGKHPALAAQTYHIIEGRPSKKADAMLIDFQAAGGTVRWHELSDKKADATFAHPIGGEVRIDWDMERAKKAQLGGKAMWSKYPRQMLRARVISEGVRTVFPGATSGMYVPEEVRDFDEDRPAQPMRDATPPRRQEAARDQQQLTDGHKAVDELFSSSEEVPFAEAEEVAEEPSPFDLQDALRDAPTLDALAKIWTDDRWKQARKVWDKNTVAAVTKVKDDRKAELSPPADPDEV